MSVPHLVEGLNSSNVPRVLRVDGADNLLVAPSGGGGFGYAGQPDETTFTQGTTPIAVMGGEYTTSPAPPASGQAAAAQITQNRALHINPRKSDGTEIGTLANPIRVDPTGGTTQPVSISGSVPATVADGSDVTLGAKADTAITDSTTSNTLMSFVKGLVKILADVWNSSSHWLQVSIQNATLAVTQSGSWSVTANAGTNLNTSSLALESGGNLQTCATDLNTLAGIVSFGSANVKLTGALNINTPNTSWATLSAWSSATALNATQGIVTAAGQTNEGAPAVIVQLDQTTTITGGAITFEISYDQGNNWVTCAADAILDPTSTTFAQISLPYTLQASTNKAFLILMKGGQQLRIKLSTQITGSGTVTPYTVLLPYNPAQTVVALSPTAANFKVDLSGTGANSTAIKVDGSAVTQPVSGTVTANAGTGTFTVQDVQTAGAPATFQLKIATTGTAVQGPNNTVKNGVIITAKASNTADILIGGSAVTNTEDGTGNGYILAPGASVSFAVDNTNRLYFNGTSGDIASGAGS